MVPRVVGAVPRFSPRSSLPQYEQAALAEQGVRKVSGTHLVLYTDLAHERVEQAPLLVDRLFPVLVERFGEPVSAEPDQPWKAVGHVIANRELFQTLGLLPEDLPRFPAGISRGDAFWIHDQETDYYRYHLLLHEATHCFMDSVLGGRGPAWFAEGNAEMMATHRWADGELRFAVMPRNPEEVQRLGRIEMVQEAVRKKQGRTVDEIMSLAYTTYDAENSSYAWSWALCAFLDGHPRYRSRFRRLHSGALASDFNDRVRELYAADWGFLKEEFQLFAANLTYGYDPARCALDFSPGKPISVGETQEVCVASDRGWQNTGVRVEAGECIELQASGRFSLADEPRVWHSEAGGLSYRYVQGKPIGRLVAGIRSDSNAGGSGLLEVLDVGRGTELVASAGGTLYLRINDDWGKLDDNRGELRVRIVRQNKPR